MNTRPVISSLGTDQNGFALIFTGSMTCHSMDSMLLCFYRLTYIHV